MQANAPGYAHEPLKTDKALADGNIHPSCPCGILPPRPVALPAKGRFGAGKTGFCRRCRLCGKLSQPQLNMGIALDLTGE